MPTHTLSIIAGEDIAKIIDSVVAAAKRKTGSKKSAAASADFIRFIHRFFEGCPPDELKERSPEELHQSAQAAWEWLQNRKPGAPKICVRPSPDKIHTTVLIVNDDMPFLVDSVTAELERMEMAPHLLIYPHLSVRRDKQGKLTSLLDQQGGKTPAESTVESLMHIEVSDITEDGFAERLVDNLTSILNDVHVAVRDWQVMRRSSAHIAADFDGPSPGVSADQAEEVADFLTWLHDDHFTFLGYRRFSFSKKGKAQTLHIDHKKGLGVLTKARLTVFDGVADNAPIPPQFSAFLDSSNILLIVKANQRATVHRRVHYDAVAIKIFDEKGRPNGMHLFVGLFTADVYTNSPSFVPVLRRKIDRIRDSVGYRKHSHDGKALQNIMENLPRDELFESSDEYLLETAVGILHLQQRVRPAVFMRLDQFERFASILVFVPRDQYDTALRVAIADILVKALDGRLSRYFTQVTDSPLARVHYIVATRPGHVPDIDKEDIEARVVRAAQSWTDDLHTALVEAHGESRGERIADTYAHAFPISYREHYEPQTAVDDIARIDACLQNNNVGIHVYQPPGATAGTVHFKIYNPGGPIPLSDAIPVLEHMGFRVIGEDPFQIRPMGSTGGRGPVMLHDFEMAIATAHVVDISQVCAGIEEAFLRVWSGGVESDGFNKLVALGGLGWREVVILRAYAKYLRQAAFRFSQPYIEDALAAHPQIAALLTKLFLTTLDPALHTPAKRKKSEAAITKIRKEINRSLEQVSSADEDRILRRYLNLIDCTLRTNFFQSGEDGAPKSYLSFKLNSRGIDELPLPRPMVEVFVYSPRVEAIHLRGGKVARGGLRWSDRREDFRSEILGLVKAQMVKNAVIVPTGSKGGFVVKQPPSTGGREAMQQEGIECYKTLQRGLLDITDNVVKDKIVHPKNVVRRDEDDPYLVVAADKGTATFSDIANGVSEDYGFWLGDAYASGGSVGYDHKAMGITARGAWESVKRHFREMGIDTQSEDFTCIGVGDMSGDVFGNGMLLSKHIKLVAAFNHLHIFIDPDPNAAKSYIERERLFKLPRSSWADYNTKLISKGGGIFDRSAKSLKLTPQIKALLDLNKSDITPTELITAILKSRTDLLFFGGIGTYIKGSGESHADASDRANDSLRIDGEDLRVKVVGEGANLGLTQRGRIEAAAAGVRLNTDAIDNSAGVDCSDHEVNIKILLNDEMNSGKLTLKARNKTLVEMTNEVAQLVLRDNYQQTQTISQLQKRGSAALEDQQRTMKFWEREGLLNREIEYLPSDEEIQERIAAGQGLSRPELSVFLPYGKMWLYEKIVASDLPDDPLVEEDLINYFPTKLRKVSLGAIKKHKLRREIIATVITNSFVNRVGPSFLTNVMDRTGLGPVDIARAYTVTRAAYGLRDLWNAIESLDNKVPADTQMDMLLEITRMIERSVLWMLRHAPTPMNMGATIKKLKPGVDELRKTLSVVCSDEVASYVKSQADSYISKGVPKNTAQSVATFYRLSSANEISTAAEATKQTQANVAKLYFLVGQRFGLDSLLERAESFSSGSHWDKLAVSAAIEELYGHQATITRTIIGGAKKKTQSIDKVLEAWVSKNAASIDRYDQVLTEVKNAESLSLSMLTVAIRQLNAMTS